MSDKLQLRIDNDAWLELCNIGNGTFSPLTGFMTSKDYRSVVNDMRLVSGKPWTIPITLDIEEEQRANIAREETVDLINEFGTLVGQLRVEDVFQVDFGHDLKKVFRTDSQEHPGVKMEASRSRYRIGGAVKVIQYQEGLFPELALTPAQTKEIFCDRGWRTMVGFQTRNPIHRAHEYLQRLALESYDGLFLQPLIGWKKSDDFSPQAVVSSYRKQTSEFYPWNRAVLGVLKTPMRYAGPREAVFHAIVRRNHGCTHFIVGRDHAGVGDYYGLYDAQELCRGFPDLGIDILSFKGPYYCRTCRGIVTENSCAHGEEHTIAVSGSKVRQLFASGIRPGDEYMRKEIADVLLELAEKNQLFVGSTR